MLGLMICLMNCLLYIFQEASFSQMDNLYPDKCLYFEILVCENGYGFTDAP